MSSSWSFKSTDPSSDVPENWSAYEARIERVNAYLHQHFAEPLDLDQLADIACLSRFHWHRIYRAIQGETIAQALKRIRMTKAGFEIANSDASLQDVALRHGYPSVRSFARAFSDIYGVPPGTYRQTGGHSRYVKTQTERTKTMYAVEIRDLPEQTIAGVMHEGSYLNIGESFERLVGIAATRGLMKDVRGMVGVYYDDPMATPEPELRSQAALIVEDGADIDAPMAQDKLSGGRYAVLTHKGPYSDLPAAYDWFYASWLKEAGLTIREAPPYENYLNSPREVATADLLTEICVPING